MRHVLFISAVVFSAALYADSTNETLRQEFEAYKAISEARIQALENQTTNQTGLTRKELDDLRMLAERGTFDFEFHGYLRAGFGVDGQGNSQAAFQAPNANSKYRLGNEAETYLETAFVAKTPEETTGSSDKKFETHIRLAYSIPNSNTLQYDSTFSLREAYGTAGGLFAENPSATWWAGQRFYSRIQVHMTDYWYRDMSGYGGGIENVDLNGRAKASLAWIGGSIDRLDSDGTVFINPDGQLRKDNIDLSLTEIDSLGGEFRVLLTYSHFNGDQVATAPATTNTLQNSHGAAINLFQLNKFDNGIQNLAVVQYGLGSAYNFRGELALPTGFDVTGTPVVKTEDFQQFRVIEDFTVAANKKISASAVALYQYMYMGHVPMNIVHWSSLGVRPVYHFNRNYSVATEAGWDYTDQKDGNAGSLFKLTFAPQITPEPSVLSRPALRLFVTYAWWSDDFKGLVGSPTHATETQGLSAGVQLETWW